MSHHTAVFDAWHTAWAYSDVVATSRASAPAWQAHQTLRLEELLHDAALGSRLYRKRLNEAGPGATAHETLQRLRPVSKRELMQHFADWVTDPALTLPALRAFVKDRSHRGEAFLGRYLVWESSGSSGEPALFVQDERALAVADALEAARGPISLATSNVSNVWSDWWLGSDAGPQRIALVAATDGHFASVVAFERARALNPWLGATSKSFSFLQPMAHLVEQVIPWVPTRQWVLSVPVPMRYLMAYDSKVLSYLIDSFTGSIFSWLRKKAKQTELGTASIESQPGAITLLKFLDAGGSGHTGHIGFYWSRDCST